MKLNQFKIEVGGYWAKYWALNICKQILAKILANGTGLGNLSEKENGLELYHLQKHQITSGSGLKVIVKLSHGTKYLVNYVHTALDILVEN